MNPMRQINRKALTVAITTALMATTQSMAVLAQDQAADEQMNKPQTLEEIVVTAQRREQSIVEIPYNISAISGDFIDKGLILTTAELLQSVPGAAVIDMGNRNTGVVNTIRIRGLAVDSNINGDYALSTVPTVSTYLNDTPIFANMILKDLSRVEVLRGPQGTLYGSGSLGGTVRYIANRPVLDEFEGYVEGRTSVTDGSSGWNWGVDTVLNIPMGDTMAARIVAGYLDDAGVIDLPNVYVVDGNDIPVAPDGVLSDTAEYKYVKDADSAKIDYIRASLLFQPNDEFDALLTYAHQRDKVDGRMQPTPGNDGWGDPYGKYQNGSVQREPGERTVNLGSLEMNYDMGFASLVSSTSYYQTDGSSTSENTGFYAQQGWLGAFYYNYPRPMASAVRSYDNSAFVQELRLVSKGGEKFDWVAGAFYQDEDKNATQDSYLRGFYNWAEAAWGCCVLNDNDFAYERDENFKDWALFGELTWNVTDRFHLTGGFRYYDVKYKNNTHMEVGLYDSFHVVDDADFSGSDNGTLWKFNASYDINDDVMAYGTYSQGYRRGGANAVPLSGVFAEDPVWQTYDSDSVDNYEIGIKGTGNNSFWNIDFFYVDWKDIQLNTATTNWAFFAVQNGGTAHTTGIEAEYDWYFAEDWHLNAGYAYIDGKLDENLYSPTDPGQLNPIALDGATLPGLAKSTFNLAVDNTYQLSSGWDWNNRVSVYYQSSMENSILPSPSFAYTLGGFSLWDFNSTLASDNWAITLFVKNLFNEKGVVGLFTEQYMGTDPAQNYYGNGSKEYIARPRTIGLNVRYNF